MRCLKIAAYWLLSVLLLLVACEKEHETKTPPVPPPLVSAYFYVGDDAGAFDAPFPIEHMRRDDGTVRFDRMPNDADNIFAAMFLAQANELSIGFSRNAAVFFRFDGEINADNLPANWADSLADDCPVFLVNVEPGSAHYGERMPLTAYWQPEMDNYHPRFLLALLPYQGRALAEGELYAAVVMRALGDNEERPLAVNPTFAGALNGDWPDGEFAATDAPAFAVLDDYLSNAGLNPDDLAVATVFRTAAPVAQMTRLRNAVAALDDPVASDFKVIAEYPDYYVIEGDFRMPIYQDGARPYWTAGGQIRFDENGAPVFSWWEKVRFSISVPKGTMPAGGWPLLFYAAGQGGSYTQIFDRSPDSDNDPGEGPGKLFAQRGISCLGIEAALTGPRQPLGSSTGIEFWNPFNLAALTDNVRQAAAEYTFLIKLARGLNIDPALAPLADAGGAESFFFDADNFFFWGHSTGASIGHLVLAVEPGFRAGMLTGAGVSWIDNVIYKQSPLPIGEIMKWVLNAHAFNEYHPLLTVWETAVDTSEAANFDPLWVSDPPPNSTPKDVLLIAGYPDTYFPAPMIEGMEVAVGVDLAGEEVIPDTIAALEVLSGRGQIGLPAEGNLTVDGADYTGVIVQYAAPTGVDGHYVAFVMDEPRYQYTCFFRNIAALGRAIVPAANDDVSAACE